MKYFIKTFGCQQNKADSERIAGGCIARGMKEASTYDDANYVVINTCMVRETAENRVYGLIDNLGKIKEKKLHEGKKYKIVVTGCMVGIAFRDKTGKYLKRLRSIMPQVDEFLPIEEVGFDIDPIRQDKRQASVPISNGCNNFCTFCVVPFTRGREISRPYGDIIAECSKLMSDGFKTITLLGQNVNSYGADLVIGEKNVQVMRDIDTKYFDHGKGASNEQDKGDTFSVSGKQIRPVYVMHLGRQRIPTLFPFLLEDIAKIGFEKVDFVSSNPWDFSQELIDVIARNENITRTIHLPVQSGDDEMLKRMNRWYTRGEYINLVSMIRKAVPTVRFTTDIIVGFCGETEEQFENTYQLAKLVHFEKAYISMYSPRPMTAATKALMDDVPHPVKKERWLKLESLINSH